MGKKKKGVKIQIKAKVVFELSPGNFSLFFSVNFDGIKTDQKLTFSSPTKKAFFVNVLMPRTSIHKAKVVISKLSNLSFFKCLEF